jgi:hypothetical protein
MRFVIFVGGCAITFRLHAKLFEDLSKPGVNASAGRRSRHGRGIMLFN